MQPGVRGRNRSEPASGKPDGLIPAPRFERHCGSPNPMKLESEIVRPGTNTKLAATSPEIICPFGIRAGSLLDVLDNGRKRQQTKHAMKGFQHVLSLELAHTYRRKLVRKMWIKQ